LMPVSGRPSTNAWGQLLKRDGTDRVLPSKGTKNHLIATRNSSRQFSAEIRSVGLNRDA
jgi:hypothetical protein